LRTSYHATMLLHQQRPGYLDASGTAPAMHTNEEQR
jgi:hypothetical protein